MDTERQPCVLGCRNRKTGKPFAAQPGYLTCDLCADELRANLREIAELYPMTDQAVMPGAADTGSRGSPGYGSRSPARDSVLALTDPRTHADDNSDPLPVLHVLSSWADNVREDVGLLPRDVPQSTREDARRLVGWLGWVGMQTWALPLVGKISELSTGLVVTLGLGGRTVAGEVSLLTEWLDHITRQYWVSDLGEEVRTLVRDLRTVLNVDERSVPVGRCPATVPGPVSRSAVRVRPAGQSRPCGAALRVRLGNERIVCPACGTSWARDQWDELSGALGTPTCDVAALSAWLDVPVGTLRRWRGEDQWTAHGTNKRRPLYARTEVLASWQQRRGTVARTA